MHNKFRKVSAVVMAMLMMASFSSCSVLESGLSDLVNTTTIKTEDSEDTKDVGSDDGEGAEMVESFETRYKKGIELLKTGNYSEALALFESCGDYEYAPDLVNVCRAEIEFKSGRYSSALTYYRKVSEKAEVPDLDVQQRKSNLPSRIALVKMAGSYRVTSNNITMTKYKKKKKVQWWYNIGIWSDQYMELSCTENADGTFDVTGYVQFQRYTKFAKKKSKIKKGVYKLPINLKKITKFPAKITLAKGVTLTRSDGGIFAVNYSKTTKSGKTKIVYKSRVTYKKAN